MPEPSTYIFAGGGTGGHLTPGLAVAAALRRREPEARIVFVGTDRPVERQLIPADYAHRDLPVEPGRMLWRRPWRFLWGNLRALGQARSLLRVTGPRAVIGLGGFASVPIVVAASRQGIPTLLLEQNVIPGRANRWLSRFADRVCVSFDATVPLLPRGRAVVTGNPVRAEIAALVHEEVPPSTSTVLVLGGSQGAAPINKALLSAAADGRLAGWHVVHQTGAADESRVREGYARHSVSSDVAAFFTDMADRYRKAAFVVSRAGATTLAELACAGRPAVLVPYPQAADDHQRHNALAFAAAGAAELVIQEANARQTGVRIAEALAHLQEPTRYHSAAQALRGLGCPDAASRIVELIP